MTGDDVLFQNWYFLRVKNMSSHAHKKGSLYLSKDPFKISDEHFRPFYMEVPLLDVYALISTLKGGFGTCLYYLFACIISYHELKELLNLNNRCRVTLPFSLNLA